MTPSDDPGAFAHAGPLPPATPDPATGFWLTHIRTGFVIFIAETLAVMAYLALTPQGPHRRILWAVAGAWLITGTVSLRLATWVAAKPWRVGYSVTWTVLSAFALAGVVSLDSVLDSPLLVLLFIPVTYAALAFTTRAATLCGLSTIAAGAMVSLTDPAIGKSGPDALMFFAGLVGVGVLSVAAAANRTRLERHERQLMADIVKMAEVDGLTGCAVPRVFRRRAGHEIARATRYNRPLCVLMIDVDRFKSINDTLGHLAGDRVLATVGTVLRANTRSVDLAGRLGGDEFAVLAPDADLPDASTLADRIRDEFTRMAEVPVTLSIGIGSFDPSTSTAEQMLNDADLALYEIKRSGGNGTAVRVPTARRDGPATGASTRTSAGSGPR